MGYLGIMEFAAAAPRTRALAPRSPWERRSDVGSIGTYGSQFREPAMQVRGIPHGAKGTVATLKAMREAVLGPEGAHNRDVRLLAQKIVAEVGNKDYQNEARALFDFMRTHVRYTLDPRGLEWVQTPWWTTLVIGQGDCFAKGTRVLLREGHKLVAIESLREGDEVWGYDRWSTVQRTWERGVRATYLIRLSNGSSVRLTPEHKVWVARCRHQTECSCPIFERKLERITVSELRACDVVTRPDSVPFGLELFDKGRAYVEGLYLSEGWSEKYRFAISGRDGFPREQQKREVESVCAELGISTSWHKRFIRVNDREWTSRLACMGKHGTAKAALSIALEEKAARELLRGILADSGRNTRGGGRTFTTTSRELWLQARTLLKMCGISCSSRYLASEEHKGLGSNGVWRLGIPGGPKTNGLGRIYDKARRASPPVEQEREDPRRALLRVKEVVRDGAELPCFDVATDDHFVWLPEADWSTSQCDDHSTATVAMAVSLGHGGAFRTYKGDRDRPDEWSHVVPMIGVRQGGRELWLPADSTEARAEFGRDPPGSEGMEQKTWVVVPA